jgi:uncharacterized protein (TIGR00251 family)
LSLPIAPAENGVIVTIKLTPKARGAGIDGIAEEPAPEGRRSVLKVRVSEPPEGGKANAALIALLAKAWRLPKSGFTIVSGDTHRLKRVHVAGSPQTLMSHIAARIGAP